jgi:hypothetical protein
MKYPTAFRVLILCFFPVSNVFRTLNALILLSVLVVLFKLIQMQKVDVRVLERLIDRFFELDPDKSGSLTLGVEVPNAEQVVEMQAMTEGTGMTLQEAWKKHLSCKYRLRAEVFLPDKDEIVGQEGEDKEAVVKESELADVVKEAERRELKECLETSKPESGSIDVDSLVNNKVLPAKESLSSPSVPSALEGRVPNKVKLSKVYCL